MQAGVQDAILGFTHALIEFLCVFGSLQAGILLEMKEWCFRVYAQMQITLLMNVILLCC